VRALDQHGAAFTLDADGLHEIDHINGITFVTRADPKTLREINPEDFEECEEGDEEYEDGEEEDSIVAIDETTEKAAD